MKWLVAGMRRTSGSRGLLAAAGLTVLGSAALAAMSMSVVFLVRTQSSGGEDLLPGIPTPSVPVGVLLAIIVVGGAFGAFLFQAAERRAGELATAFADDLRGALFDRVAAPEALGWHVQQRQRLPALLSRSTLGGVREISVAAREVVRLIGPITMTALTLTALLAIDAVATVALAPLAALFAAVAYVITRKMDDLNGLAIASQGREAADVAALADELSIGAASDATLASTRASALAGDQVVHGRMLYPAQLRALGLFSTACFAALVFIIFRLQTPSGEQIDFARLILFLIVSRLCAAGANRMALGAIGIVRRGGAIRRYRTVLAAVDAYGTSRRSRTIGTSSRRDLTLPFRGIDGATAGPDSYTASAAERLVVLVPARLPAADIVPTLMLLESEVDAVSTPVDLLATSRIVATGGGLERTDARVVVALGCGDGNESLEILITPHVNRVRSAGDGSPLAGVVVVIDGAVVASGPRQWARKNLAAVTALVDAARPER